MRSKVASHYGGHAFEKRYLDLDPIRLSILYKQAKVEENEKKDWTLELVKTLNEAWTNKFKNWFELLQVYTNPKLFVAMEDEKEMQQYRDEISEDNFMDEWEKMMQIIPEEMIVDESDAPGKELQVPKIDEETEKLIIGWVTNHAGS
jgi:hypothetical protein